MSTGINFVQEMSFEYGRVDLLSGGIRRVIARNPSAFTFHGTGTYILGIGQVAVIDPGPADPAHIEALGKALQGETVSHILVTHTHRDHSPGVALLKAHCDAPAFAYGRHGSGQTDVVVGTDNAVVEEGADNDFQPDETVRHGDVIEGLNWSVECVYTPGHTSNHMCYQLREEKALFTGDHVMGWSTSVIAPPDGDMAAYINSLELLLERDDALYWPTHGPAITEPKAHVRAFIEHRNRREAQILECIGAGHTKIVAIVAEIYQHHAEAVLPAAARSVFAAILYLIQRGKLVCSDAIPQLSSTYAPPS